MLALLFHQMFHQHYYRIMVRCAQFLLSNKEGDETHPLYHSEATTKGVNLTVDQELVCGLRRLHIVQTTDTGSFVGNILAV